MGTTRKRDEQAVATARRMVRFLWVLGLVPLVVVLAAGWQTSRTEVWVDSRGIFLVPEGVFHLQVGHDRRGDHVAVLGRDRNTHVLGLKNGRIVTQRLQYPWPEVEGFRVRLALADATNDDLVDILLMRFAIDESAMNDGRPREEPWDCAVFRQERGGFVKDRIEPRTPVINLDEDNRSLSAYGEQLALATVTQAGQPMTQVFSPEAKRVIELLEGEPYASRDLDGDGNQDLLTAEERFDLADAGLNTLRLYLFREDRVHAVWSSTFENLDLWRTPRRYTALADLDGDVLCEIVVGEPQTGELEVFALDPADLAG